MKRLLFILILVSFSSTLYCETTKEKMDDALGRAYKASTEKKLNEAKDWFRKGIQYAKEANSWQGLIDSGYGLSTMGLPEEAKAAFDSASQIIHEKPNWHAAVALGYAYASLPREMGAIESAVKMWTKAKEWANNENDPYGLLEVGRGFMSILKNKEAEECLDLAKEIIKKSPSEHAVKTIVQAYRKLGREDKALECAKCQPEAEKSPPLGWMPKVGEGIRGPKTVPSSIQQTQRESADKDIERKQAWEQEEARLKQEERARRETLAYQAYRDYLYYYSYPYYGVYTGVITNCDDYYIYTWTTQPVWVVRTYDEVYNWALWNLGRYTCVNGVYIAVDID